jgi:hypothetical protein
MKGKGFGIIMSGKYQGHRLDHWSINLSMEVIMWREVLDDCERLIDFICSLKSS